MIIHEYMARMHHEELLADAERRRLIKGIRRHPHWFVIDYDRSLTWLGDLICRWGSLLARRFGEETTINQSASIKDSLCDSSQS